MEGNLLFSAKPISDLIIWNWLVEFLYNWQTLFGAFIAVLAPFIFWFFIDRQEKKKKKKEILIEVEKSLAITLNELLFFINQVEDFENYFREFRVQLNNFIENKNESMSPNPYDVNNIFFSKNIMKYELGNYLNNKLISHFTEIKYLNFHINTLTISYKNAYTILESKKIKNPEEYAKLLLQHQEDILLGFMRLKEQAREIKINMFATHSITGIQLQKENEWKKINFKGDVHEIIEKVEKYFADEIKKYEGKVQKRINNI
jgi:hypothetical protein